MLTRDKFNVMTFNVRGLRNQVKRRSIFCFLKDQNCEAYFLQESYSEPNDKIIWRSEWGGVIFFSHGSTHSKGVCILMNHSLNYTFQNSCRPKWKNRLSRFKVLLRSKIHLTFSLHNLSL